MVGHQRLPWTNNSTQGAISVTSAKQEQEITSGFLRTCRRLCPLVGLSTLCLSLLATCAALSVLYSNESDTKPEWKSLFDYQNMSDSYLTLTKANTDLKKENEILKEHSARQGEQTKLLNRTSVKLRSISFALSLENGELKEQIVNLTSTNIQLMKEHEQLVQYKSEQEERRLNVSQTIKYLFSSNSQLQEEKRRLSEANNLLRDELFQLKEENQQLVEISDKRQEEIQNLSKKIEAFSKDDCEKLEVEVTQLQEQNQNLSTMLGKERQEAAEQERSRTQEMEQMVADVQSMSEAYDSLDLYCPVVNQRTKERICKKCHDSWRQFETKCYYFSSRVLSWSSSRAWCRTQGGDLLIINSEQEQNFVFDASRALEQSGTRLWIGMTDAEDEGDWRWVDGSKVTSDVKYWLSRQGMGTEPDDWKLDDPSGEDCGHIDTSESALRSWMDGSCNIPYRWICEKNA
ncbi:C-type lectin domain family 10 member A-like isoform X2 [Toxotes jaculatrix]|nr:C-type lectin domain family 10 member A-like isoform X2 [Toxotes jaculatrix]XP_040923078.1 C-type lectin domain family 10 member A-like isoform X2 [Toxotes jaculatrix]XP_040923079.1 C-type lectin domain family 10 member A-like isoform X2 [Toxotes jaculatrix]